MPNAPRPKAILFDLDDTLISTHIAPVEGWKEVVGEVLPAESDADREEIARAIVAAAKHFWSDPERHKEGRKDLRIARHRIVANALAHFAFFSDKVKEELTEGHIALYHRRLALYPDAIETLAALRAEKVRLALVTNGASDIQRAKVARFDLAPHFDHIQIEGEAGVGKPEPEAYRKALAALDAHPSETWMVGDNLEWEVAAPQRFGIRGIWRDPRGKGKLPDTHIRPDRVITHLKQLVKE